MKSLNEKLQIKFKKQWKLNIYLLIDEIIQRFINRVKKIINIFSKSVAKSFKIWILFNNEYILNWMYHVKNEKKNLVDLNFYWIENLNFSKIETIILNFVTQKNIFNDRQHVI